MNVPDSINAIVQLTYPYMAQAGGQRPMYNKTLADGLEIEIKIPIRINKDVITVMDTLLSYGLCGAEHRSETHYVYQLEDGAHLNRMHIKGASEIWLKTKSKNMPITTPRYKLPAVCRTGKKLKPSDIDYEAAYDMTRKLPLVTSFKKECLNFFYLYHHCIFSLSFSLGWNEDGFLTREMEFEYEGHTHQEIPPSRREVEEILESMMVELVSADLRKRAHATTKYESLTAAD